MKASFLRDAIPLVVAAALAIFAICWSFTFKEVPPILIRGFQPGAFPRLVAGLILILSVLAWIEITRAQPDDYAPSRLPAAFWQSMLVLAIFTCLLMIGDLLFALMIATAGLSFAWGERRIAGSRIARDRRAGARLPSVRSAVPGALPARVPDRPLLRVISWVTSLPASAPSAIPTC